MKKLLITAVIATMFSIAAFADGGKKATTDEGVTYAALNQFKTDFKSADDVMWAVTPNCQKVSFTQNNVDYTAFYSFDGDYLGITQNVSYKRMPSAVKKEITKEYKGYEVNSVIKYKTHGADEPVIYFVDLKNTAKEIVLKVTPDRSVTFFKEVK